MGTFGHRLPGKGLHDEHDRRCVLLRPRRRAARPNDEAVRADAAPDRTYTEGRKRLMARMTCKEMPLEDAYLAIEVAS